VSPHTDPPFDPLDHIETLAGVAGQTTEEFLRDALAAQTRRRRPPPPPPTVTLYQRLEYAGGLRRIVHDLYPRVLADRVLMGYFKHLGDHGLSWLRWHMLTFLAIATGGPSKYAGRDLHAAHQHLLITGEAFDRLLEHLAATMGALEVAWEDRQAVLAMVQEKRDAVVTFDAS